MCLFLQFLNHFMSQKRTSMSEDLFNEPQITSLSLDSSKQPEKRGTNRSISLDDLNKILLYTRLHADVNVLTLYRLHEESYKDIEKESRVQKVIDYYTLYKVILFVFCIAIALIYFLINCGVPTPQNIILSAGASAIILISLQYCFNRILRYVPKFIFGKMKFDGSQLPFVTALLVFGGAEEIQAYHLEKYKGVEMI